MRCSHVTGAEQHRFTEQQNTAPTLQPKDWGRFFTGIAGAAIVESTKKGVRKLSKMTKICFR